MIEFPLVEKSKALPVVVTSQDFELILDWLSETVAETVIDSPPSTLCPEGKEMLGKTGAGGELPPPPPQEVIKTNDVTSKSKFFIL